jgi:hypothetical protein
MGYYRFSGHAENQLSPCYKSVLVQHASVDDGWQIDLF